MEEKFSVSPQSFPDASILPISSFHSLFFSAALDE
jgi:hypothetical protein